MKLSEQSRYRNVGFDAKKSQFFDLDEKNLTNCLICGNPARLAYYPPSPESALLPDDVERVAMPICQKHKSAMNYARKVGKFHSPLAFIHEQRLIADNADVSDPLWVVFGKWLEANAVLSMSIERRLEALSDFLASSPAHRRMEATLHAFLTA